MYRFAQLQVLVRRNIVGTCILEQFLSLAYFLGTPFILQKMDSLVWIMTDKLERYLCVI